MMYWLHVFFIFKTVGHHFWPGQRLNKEEKQKITLPAKKKPGPIVSAC